MPTQKDATAVMHVVPQRLGDWHVCRERDGQPLSTHNSATEAERSALAVGARAVVVHDRYERVHMAGERQN